MKQSDRMKKKILIIDDDADLSMIIEDMLTDYGYEVTYACDSDQAYALLETHSYHLIILDINLPVVTGFEVCKEIRQISTVPVIFASARTSEDDKITGLDIGGDDYLAKPYSLKELLSRVNSLIRRAYGFAEPSQVYQLGTGTENEIRLESTDRTVLRNGEQVALSLKEYDLLLYMMQHMGMALKKEQLLSEVWGTFSGVELSTLTVHIRWLREKLEQNPSSPKYIQTVWGIGYKISDQG